MGGQAFSSWQSIAHYFNLAEANKQLADENILLRAELKNSFLDRDIGKLLRFRLKTSRKIVKMSIYRKQSLGAHYIKD